MSNVQNGITDEGLNTQISKFRLLSIHFKSEEFEGSRMTSVTRILQQPEALVLHFGKNRAGVETLQQFQNSTFTI